VSHSVLNEIFQGRVDVSVTITFRIAKMLDVSLHHVLTGVALSPGTCKHCGRSNDEADLEARQKLFDGMEGAIFEYGAPRVPR
jgi:hypothetical protein